MKKRLSTCLGLLLSAAMLFGQLPGSIVDNQVIVALEKGTNARSATLTFAEFGLMAIKEIPTQGIFLCRTTGSQNPTSTLIQQLQSHPSIQYAGFNHYLEERNVEPNDPLYANQWGMNLIQAPRIWEFTTGGLTADGDTIVIGVLDSGFDIDHADLVDNLWTNWAEKNGIAGIDDDQNGYVDDVYGYNFAQNKPEHADGNHGNPVTGILGASGNNEEGVSGVNWSVKVVPMTVFTDFDIIEAYQYVQGLRDLYQSSEGAEGALVV
ncbi:MAG: S8 family serine peptidase, partial [Bacteroidota bacterium]